MINSTPIPNITPEEFRALWPDHPNPKKISVQTQTEDETDSFVYVTSSDPKSWPFPTMSDSISTSNAGTDTITLTNPDLKTRWATFEKELDEMTLNHDWNRLAVDLNTPPQDSTVEVLTERAKNYGKFSGIGQLTQTFKEIMREAPSWQVMQPDQKESLEMIVHKLARILNGNPDYADSWVDIAGYARLVADRLETGLER